MLVLLLLLLAAAAAAANGRRVGNMKFPAILLPPPRRLFIFSCRPLFFVVYPAEELKRIRLFLAYLPLFFYFSLTKRVTFQKSQILHLFLKKSHIFSPQKSGYFLGKIVISHFTFCKNIG